MGNTISKREVVVGATVGMILVGTVVVGIYFLAPLGVIKGIVIAGKAAGFIGSKALVYKKVGSLVVIAAGVFGGIIGALVASKLQNDIEDLQQRMLVIEAKSSYDRHEQGDKTVPTISLQTEATAAQKCCVCFEHPPCVAFLPCGHLCVCSACADSIVNTCPICRDQFVSKLPLFVVGVPDDE